MREYPNSLQNVAQENQRVSEYAQSRKRKRTNRNPISHFYLIQRKASRVLNALEFSAE